MVIHATKYKRKEMKCWTPAGDDAGRLEDTVTGMGMHKNTHRIQYVSAVCEYMYMYWLECTHRKHIECLVVTGCHVWQCCDLKMCLSACTQATPPQPGNHNSEWSTLYVK